MDTFKLSASLTGHEDDIKALTFPHPSTVFSASRDATVRRWKRRKLNDEPWECDIVGHGSEFVNSITYVPQSDEFPKGLILSGGKEAVIDVRQADQLEGDPQAVLVGHSHNVCALDTSPSGEYVASGSWDSSARIWRIGSWEQVSILEGHEGSVWAVMFWDDETVITACADTYVRVFHRSGKLIRKFEAGHEVVRALCCCEATASGQFASAGNDGVIRIWNLQGGQIAELRGHENFIYSLASLPNGDLASSSEDRTIRLWRNNTCIQTITHPAISVWTVATNKETGDIVSGSSDRIIRVFTRDPTRTASAEAVKAFEDSVAQSAIPQQATDIKKDELPGPEFIQQKSGTKEGQVAMVKEDNGGVTAYQWSMSTASWVSVGTVVEGAGSSGKKVEYMGADYDYVFDVDIAEGQPALKLPFNLSQNPYEAATKFIEDNELPMAYLDQTAQFIVSNTQGATLGQPEEPRGGPDPFGEENRYRPGDSGSTYSRQPSIPKVLPQKDFLLISQANVPPIQKKLVSVNDALIKAGEKGKAFNPEQIASLEAMVAVLPKTGKQSAELKDSSEISDGCDVLMRALTTWTEKDLLPVLDFLRLIALQNASLAEWRQSGGEECTLIGALDERDLSHRRSKDGQANGNVCMLMIRLLANLFATPAGVDLARSHVSSCLDEAEASSQSSPSNRNLQIAETTLLINFAVLSTRRPGIEVSTGLRMLKRARDIAGSAEDSEVAYRALVVTGTLISAQKETRGAVQADRSSANLLGGVEKKFAENRIKGVCAEIRQLLAG